MIHAQCALVLTRGCVVSLQRGSYPLSGHLVLSPRIAMPRKGRRWTMSEQEMKSLLTTMKTMGHEALAHDLFFDCFPELGSVMKIGGLKTTSLFRMALLYFLFVPDARERLLKRLRRPPERKG